MLSTPQVDIFDQSFTVSPYNATTSGVRLGTMTFGGNIVQVKESSW
jgi:hypothetical protein